MTTMHDIAIRTLLSQFPDLETRRFMSSMREAIDVDKREFEGLIIIPDAYKIDPGKMIIYCFEVEYGHPVSSHTMSKYSDLWWVVSFFDWDLVLVVVDKWGVPTRDICVGNYAIRKLVADHPPKPPHLRDPIWVDFYKRFSELNPAPEAPNGGLS